MGYETKLYVCRKYKYLSHLDIMAVFDVGKMDDYRFRTKSSIFDTPIEKDSLCDPIVIEEMESNDDGTTNARICWSPNEDRYGEWLHYADIFKVVEALEDIDSKDCYWRYPPILAYLKALLPAGHTDIYDIVVVHYGY